MSKTLISCTLSEEAVAIYADWKHGTKSALISELIVNNETYPLQVKALKTRVGHLMGILSEIRGSIATEMRLNPQLRPYVRVKFETIIAEIQDQTEGTIYFDHGLNTLEHQDQLTADPQLDP